jgi:hypothetical protein
MLGLRVKIKSKIFKFKLSIGGVTTSRNRVELGITQQGMLSHRTMNLRKARKELRQEAFLRAQIATRATNMRWVITPKTTELTMDKNFKILNARCSIKQTVKRVTLLRETKVPPDPTEMAKIASNMM